ncbi:MAG TPA: 4-hydroxy-3-methylbut-2-en-1-yl diphosphate synthase [Firmicutes bacterium]|jgi:(E)-4-hydroxy-3-methylbut-2-enyl-diphosphate synthase|nr:4-hydroxy-3-methylbut-2-en-1-yl diphosphate synthase [Bacillota bacterium]
MQPRRKTKSVQVGPLVIGGNHPISIQSMTTSDTRDKAATLEQIRQLSAAGCEIVRLAVPDGEAADNLAYFCKNSNVPLVADIHFDYHLALTAIEAGISKLRINPGNIGGPDRVNLVARKAKERQIPIPIRIGVNAGSLEKDLLANFGGPTPEAMVESALRHIRLLEAVEFFDIVVSLKASSVPATIEAYQLLAQQCDYPFHIGITEAGTWFKGSIRSAVGLGALLWEGLGDTLRVSLTGDPVREVAVGQDILQALQLRSFGATVVSCPTCGRCQINLESLAFQVEQLAAAVHQPLKIAVMGCAVNGPGEAREADLGVAGGKGEGLIFRKGEIIKKVPEDQIIAALKEELEKLVPGD